MSDPRDDTEPAWLRSRRRIFMICNAFKLDRQDRLEVATMLLNRNVESYADLSPAELHRLRDGFEVAVVVCKIQIERRSGERR